ncbi:dodecin domain-containing protein [Actinobacteria bacterium YIM 96077]|uniref:Dodecin family protein n=1 Tax=Phytoactinopolyspora halophila TaxID=1981511 RepID=A0A329QJ72_9ACTN|nr:dodecin domain-containing protein [Actinobacteria bacterium YIM 96077]RAW12415.1 hypothetical protein DPM12_14705 [Phytoactinopolyspora halophila]
MARKRVTSATVGAESAGGLHRYLPRGPRAANEEDNVNRTYRVTEIVGTSPEGVEQAVRNGVDRAGQTLRHLDWFEVTEIRGQIVDGQVEHFQVAMKVGFRLEDA